jgi:hypothetical protein
MLLCLDHLFCFSEIFPFSYQSKKYSGDHKRHNRNLCRIHAKKLFDFKKKFSEKGFDLYKMKKDITGDKSMINKQWLLERINKIEKI